MICAVSTKKTDADRCKGPMLGREQLMAIVTLQLSPSCSPHLRLHGNQILFIQRWFRSRSWDAEKRYRQHSRDLQISFDHIQGRLILLYMHGFAMINLSIMYATPCMGHAICDYPVIKYVHSEMAKLGRRKALSTVLSRFTNTV